MYLFFFDYVMLPIPPSKMSMSVGNTNKTVTLIDDGEINIPRSAGLKEFSFDLLIPQQKYPFAQYSFGDFTNFAGTYYLNYFELLKANKKAFQFIVVRLSPANKILFYTNETVTMEELTISEDWEEGTDQIVSITLKEFRPFGTKKCKVEQQSDGKYLITDVQARNSDFVTPVAAQFTKIGNVAKDLVDLSMGTVDSAIGSAGSAISSAVTSPDTLWTVAKQYYGTVTDSIYETFSSLNSHIGDPNNISSGEVVKFWD